MKKLLPLFLLLIPIDANSAVVTVENLVIDGQIWLTGVGGEVHFRAITGIEDLDVNGSTLQTSFHYENAGEAHAWGFDNDDGTFLNAPLFLGNDSAAVTAMAALLDALNTAAVSTSFLNPFNIVGDPRVWPPRQSFHLVTGSQENSTGHYNLSGLKGFYSSHTNSWHSSEFLLTNGDNEQFVFFNAQGVPIGANFPLLLIGLMTIICLRGFSHGT